MNRRGAQATPLRLRDHALLRRKENVSDYKVLISDAVAEVCPAILKEHGIQADLAPGLSPEALRQKIVDYHGLIVRSGTKVTAEIIDAAEQLQVIGRAGVGVDNIDVTAATRRGIVVMNAAAGNTLSTAEHTFALMLAVARRLPQAYVSLRGGAWERRKFKGTELFGKTLGVVGIGRIGRELARRAMAFGMRVVAHDPFLDADVFANLGVEALELADLLRGSDFITIHVPYSAETHYLIGEAELALCKPGAYLLNVARGGVVDEAALYKALRAGRLAGAALDVFEHEPPGESPLLNLDNVVATPHIAASTAEAQVRVAEEIARSVANFLVKQNVENLINPEVLTLEGRR